jgi:hypothetical protein
MRRLPPGMGSVILRPKAEVTSSMSVPEGFEPPTPRFVVWALQQLVMSQLFLSLPKTSSRPRALKDLSTTASKGGRLREATDRAAQRSEEISSQ